LRTACDLKPTGDLVVTQPTAFSLPDEAELLTECQRLIAACKPKFAGVTTVNWKPEPRAAKRKAEESETEAEE